MRKRRSLNKIGVLAIALVLALGILGVTYSAWVDEIVVEGTLSSSGINTTLDCGACSVDPVITPLPIECNPTSDPLEVEITITNAQAVISQNTVYYYCNFTVNNTAPDTLPVKITNVTVAQAASDPCSDTSATIINSPAGTVLDPGDTAVGGQVKIHLTSDECVGLTLHFTLTAEVERWNK